ncbi:cytidylyltransferase domain-containing protein [Halolamina sp.]|jgi:N-acylneuraminate cytidylyltransferase|uniref:acylneuraminate cytidylyltransferase family protein n=1 Tax=Halolamina sp. TaxID=1940283 RepID=UPI003561722E
MSTHDTTDHDETDDTNGAETIETVSVIPARGGSKGIKRKNIVPFLGAPLLAHTVDQSLASERIDRTYVSTDHGEIAAVAREAGAEVIDRPVTLAGDKTPTEDALAHALEEMRADGVDPQTFVLLQCTSPLRRGDDIDEAVRLVEDEGYDSALSCCRDHGFYWRAADAEPAADTVGAEPINYDPKNRSMRQELDPRYRENGSVYVARTAVLEEEGCRIGGDIGLHVMPERLSIEIDTPEDLELVEAIGRETDFYSDHANE